jgi:hypothetical protein
MRFLGAAPESIIGDFLRFKVNSEVGQHFFVDNHRVFVRMEV